jgi:hypothetical protein
MFEIYKRCICEEKNIGMMEVIRKARLFDLPLNINYEPNMERDVVLSPYKYTWVEVINSFIGLDDNLPKIGVLIHQINKEELLKLPIENRQRLLLGIDKNIDEINYCHFYFIYISWINKSLGGRVCKSALDKNGKFLGWAQPAYHKQQEDLSGICFAVLKYLSFINISNINIQSIELEKKTRKHLLRNKSNQTHYYILTVTKPTIHKENNKTNSNEKLTLPLHQVRGHLADYTEGKGLFGKYNIRIWKPDFWRGDIEYGKINKDYKINAK